jgi:hypothetical protein
VAENQNSVTGIAVLRKQLSKNHRSAAAEVAAELSIHLEDPVSTKKSDESFTNLTSTVELQLLNICLLKTSLKGEKDRVIIIKPGAS